jgi:hypothetical protein
MPDPVWNLFLTGPAAFTYTITICRKMVLSLVDIWKQAAERLYREPCGHFLQPQKVSPAHGHPGKEMTGPTTVEVCLCW